MQITAPPPSKIRTDVQFVRAFGYTEVEVTAKHIVRWCQNHGDTWEATFTDVDIPHESHHATVAFYDIGEAFHECVERVGDAYRVTAKFIERVLPWIEPELPN